MICINTSYRCICIRKAMGSFSVPLFTWWNCISTAHSLKIVPIVLFLRKLSIFNLFMIKFSDFLWTALLLVSLETPLIAAEVWILNTVMVPLCSVLEEATPGLPGRRSSRSIYSHGSSRASLFLRVFFSPPFVGYRPLFSDPGASIEQVWPSDKHRGSSDQDTRVKREDWVDCKNILMSFLPTESNCSK